MAEDSFGNYVAGLSPTVTTPPTSGGSGGSGSGVQQVYDGAWDDPNGNLTPDDTTIPAIYIKEGDENIRWHWDVTDQEWKPEVL